MVCYNCSEFGGQRLNESSNRRRPGDQTPLLIDLFPQFTDVATLMYSNTPNTMYQRGGGASPGAQVPSPGAQNGGYPPQQNQQNNGYPTPTHPTQPSTPQPPASSKKTSWASSPPVNSFASASQQAPDNSKNKNPRRRMSQDARVQTKQWVEKNYSNLLLYFGLIVGILIFYHAMSDGDFSFLLVSKHWRRMCFL